MIIEVYNLQSIHHNIGTVCLVELYNKANHLQHSRCMSVQKHYSLTPTYALVFSDQGDNEWNILDTFVKYEASLHAVIILISK